MKRKKYIEVKLCKLLIDKAITKKPICAIELYITNRFNLVWLKAKNVPKTVESNPKPNKTSCKSRKKKLREQITLIKK